MPTFIEINFYKELDRTELLEAENNPQQMASYKMRMNTKREQKDLIIDQLSYFKNIDFKYVAAEFLLWCMTESGFSNLKNNFLKLYLFNYF